MAAPSLTGLLDDAERGSALQLARTEDRARYVTSHALVRLIVAARTGVPAAELRFDRTCRRCGSDHGKPRLAGLDPSAPSVVISFSLARAGERILVATTTGHGLEVGVDVAQMPGFGDPTVTAGVSEILTAAELSIYRRLTPVRRRRALAVWWTRKEAILKATGDGLAVPPSTLEVAAPPAATALTSWVRADVHRDPRAGGSHPAQLGDGQPLCLCDLAAGPGYVGCVAVLGATSLVVTEHDADPLLRRQHGLD